MGTRPPNPIAPDHRVMHSARAKRRRMVDPTPPAGANDPAQASRYEEMRAVVVHEFGPIDSHSLEDVTDPTPGLFAARKSIGKMVLTTGRDG